MIVIASTVLPLSCLVFPCVLPSRVWSANRPSQSLAWPVRPERAVSGRRSSGSSLSAPAHPHRRSAQTTSERETRREERRHRTGGQRAPVRPLASHWPAAAGGWVAHSAIGSPASPCASGPVVGRCGVARLPRVAPGVCACRWRLCLAHPSPMSALRVADGRDSNGALGLRESGWAPLTGGGATRGRMGTRTAPRLPPAGPSTREQARRRRDAETSLAPPAQHESGECAC